MRKYPLLITLGIVSAALCAAFPSAGPAQSKGRPIQPRPQPKIQPKQQPDTYVPGSKDTYVPGSKDTFVPGTKDTFVPGTKDTPTTRESESAKQRTIDRAQIAVQNTQEMKSRDDGVVVLKKQAVENAQAADKVRLEVRNAIQDKIAQLPAGEKERMEKLFQNQGPVRTKLQNASIARQKSIRADGTTLTGFPEIQPVDPKQTQMLTSQVAAYHNTAKKLGIKLDPYGRVVNPSSVATRFLGGSREIIPITSGSSYSALQPPFMNSASMSAGGLPLGPFQPGTQASAFSILPAIGQGVAGNSIPGYVPNLGAVVIPNTTAEIPSSISAGVIPDVGGAYQIVQSLPEGTNRSSDQRAVLASEAILEEGGEEAASIPQSTRFVRFTNATDKKMKFYIHYETVDTEGKKLWLPPKVDGYSYAASVEVAAGQSVDLKEGDWRVNAARARIWAVTEDREWARYKHIDLWLVPEVDERGEHSYRAPYPETYSYTIGT